MLDFIVPFLAGGLTEYCRSRRISKTKASGLFFLGATLAAGIVCFVTHPDEAQLNIMLSLVFGLIMAATIAGILLLDERSERRKKPD